MNKFAIRIDLRTVRRATDGSIRGRFHLLLDGKIFPTREWIDEVVEVVGWWCSELALLSEEEPLAVLAFKGERHRLLVQRWCEGEIATITSLERAGEELKVRLKKLKNEVIAAGHALIASCSKRGLRGPEIDCLKEAMGWLAGAKMPERRVPRRLGNSSWILPEGRLKFRIDENRLVRTNHGSVIGPVEIRGLGRGAFPGPGWTDFVVVVLGWWCHALSQERTILQTVSFMDGPYQVLLERGYRPGALVVERVGGGSGTRLVVERELQQEVLRAARVVFEACSKLGWESADIAELGTASAELAKLIEASEADPRVRKANKRIEGKAQSKVN